MTKGRWILAVIILLAVGFATAQGLRPHPPPPVDVSTAVVKRQDVTRTVNAAGHLQARETVKVIRHLSRLEAVDWWKHLPGEGGHAGHAGHAGHRGGVDYVHAWVDEGSAWVEIDRATGQTRVCGWFD